VNNAPHQAEAKKVLDFVLSDQGQAIWANAYLRPVRASAMSKEAQRVSCRPPNTPAPSRSTTARWPKPSASSASATWLKCDKCGRRSKHEEHDPLRPVRPALRVRAGAAGVWLWFAVPG
jgi:hypothetical protein